MSGDVGELNVYIRGPDDPAAAPPVWWRENNHGSTWRQGEVDIPASLFPVVEVRSSLTFPLVYSPDLLLPSL